MIRESVGPVDRPCGSRRLLLSSLSSFPRIVSQSFSQSLSGFIVRESGLLFQQGVSGGRRRRRPWIAAVVVVIRVVLHPTHTGILLVLISQQGGNILVRHARREQILIKGTPLKYTTTAAATPQNTAAACVIQNPTAPRILGHQTRPGLGWSSENAASMTATTGSSSCARRRNLDQGLSNRRPLTGRHDAWWGWLGLLWL
mmetsp:Transcript_19062/g.52237  ORF Transcript_19062/g.52237 Transcript_19062/m.52237 type:complete len:200 (-) Transcript_19062:206-805(-)